MNKIMRRDPVTSATRRAELSLHVLMVGLAVLCGLLFYRLAAGLAFNLREETYTQYTEVTDELVRTINAMLDPSRVTVVDLKESVTKAFLQSPMAARCELVLREGATQLLTLGTLSPEPHRATNKKPIVFMQRALDPPFNNYQLIFRTSFVPLARSGSEARILVGTIIVLMFAGFSALYLLALKQVALAEERARFVAAVSHELRTPLTAIRMYTEMLQNPSLGSPGKQDEYLNLIFSESERLQHMVGDLLDLSRFARGIRRLEVEAVEVPVLFGLIEMRLGPMIANKGFSLELNDGKLQSAVVSVDQEAFLRAVFNVIDNALRYASSGERRLSISAMQTKGKIGFVIRDYGPGLRKPAKRSPDSTGIGLVLVRETVRRMRGRLEVKEANPGLEVTILLREVLRVPVS